MALGAVQSGYAGAACAYQRKDRVKRDFYGNISSAVHRMEGESENDSRVIGLAMFPCGDGKVSYGMKAQDAVSQESSAGENMKNTGTAENSDDVPEEAEDIDPMQQIRERMAEILVMIRNGDTEPVFQIGNSSFTVKEWEKFLERFDDIEDAVRELMRERIERKTEEAEAAVYEGGIDVLVSESTRCTYPASVPGQEDTMYITWYTEKGIFCRKAGQREEYEWSVCFENKKDYRRVMEFLEEFDRNDNLRFAAHENFWQDFLKNKIDLDGFKDFYAGTDHGVPDYTVTRGNSTYIDREKIRWANYMNSPGTRLYTGEEMMQIQEELTEANKAKLIKLTDSCSQAYQRTHPNAAESAFSESIREIPYIRRMRQRKG